MNFFNQAEASSSVIRDTTEAFKNSIASVNSSIMNVNNTMVWVEVIIFFLFHMFRLYKLTHFVRSNTMKNLRVVPQEKDEIPKIMRKIEFPKSVRIDISHHRHDPTRNQIVRLKIMKRFQIMKCKYLKKRFRQGGLVL